MENQMMSRNGSMGMSGGIGMGHHDGMHMSHHKMGMKMNGTGSHSDMMMMMMPMYFTAGEKVTILFKDWKTNTVGELIGSCLAIFILAIIYEGIKVGRQLLLTRSEVGTAKVFMNSMEGSELARDSVMTIMPPRKKLLSSGHIIQTILHMVQVFVGYLLMLGFMTYNCWLCIAIILGSGAGYFLFGWKAATIYSSGDHCN